MNIDNFPSWFQNMARVRTLNLSPESEKNVMNNVITQDISVDEAVRKQLDREMAEQAGGSTNMYGMNMPNIPFEDIGSWLRGIFMSEDQDPRTHLDAPTGWFSPGSPAYRQTQAAFPGERASFGVPQYWPEPLPGKGIEIGQIGDDYFDRAMPTIAFPFGDERGAPGYASGPPGADRGYGMLYSTENHWRTWLDPDDIASPSDIAEDIIKLGWDDNRLSLELDPERNVSIRSYAEQQGVNPEQVTNEIYSALDQARDRSRQLEVTDIPRDVRNILAAAPTEDPSALRLPVTPTVSPATGIGGPPSRMLPTPSTEEAPTQEGKPTAATATAIDSLFDDGVPATSYAANLQKIFFERMDQEPATTRADFRQLLPRIYADTEMLFLLDKGNKIADAYNIFFGVETDSGVLDEDEAKVNALATLTQEYTKFLEQYILNPEQYRSGRSMRAHAANVSSILSKLDKDPGREGIRGVTWTERERIDADWIESFFGPDRQGAAARRQNLINMNATNGQMDSYSQQIHRTLENLANYHRRRGKSEAEVMAFVTRTGPSTVTIESPTGEAMPTGLPALGQAADKAFQDTEQEFDPPLKETPGPPQEDRSSMYGYTGEYDDERVLNWGRGTEIGIDPTSPYQPGSYVARQEAQPGYSAAFEDPDWIPMYDPSVDYGSYDPGASYREDFANDPYAMQQSMYPFAGGPGSNLDWIIENQALANYMAGKDPNVQAARAQSALDTPDFAGLGYSPLDIDLDLILGDQEEANRIARMNPNVQRLLGIR